MKNCIICHRPIREKEMVIVAHRPTQPFSRKGVMHASCYEIMKLYVMRGTKLPLVWFGTGIIFMIIILIPGLINGGSTGWVLDVMAICVVTFSTITSMIWARYLYDASLRECKDSRPLMKKEDVSLYNAEAMNKTDSEIRQESMNFYFDVYPDPTHGVLSNDFSGDPTHTTDWALKFMSLAPNYTLVELDRRFIELSKIYQPSEINQFQTQKMRELLESVKILRGAVLNQSVDKATEPMMTKTPASATIIKKKTTKTSKSTSKDKTKSK